MQARTLEGLSALGRRSAAEAMDVYVTNVTMPFWAMVGFMIKWSIAAIPAGIILLVLTAMAWAVLAGLFGGALLGIDALFGR
jgi:hypothetical protein